MKYVFRLTQLYAYFIIFYYWLLVSASKGENQASIYKKPKMLLHILQNRQFYGIPFTSISILYNYYQPLDLN
jgi:hypothetical protein